MNLPVKVEGASPGVLNSGGVLVLNKRKLRVKALPKDLPDFIVANISKLKLGNKLYTAELQTEEYTLLHPDNTVVCQVRTSRASVKEEEDEDDTTTEEGTEGGDTASAAEISEAPAES